MQRSCPIGVFDSGYGGLTVLEKIREHLPAYDYIYFGDNARTPYGTRSFEVVYQYTLECVKKLFDLGCELVILACNTASAKALRSIQQRDLPLISDHHRVLGVIRPTVEQIGHFTKSNHVGLLATQGTVQSRSYDIEIGKYHPQIVLHSEACPMWVPLIENGEADSNGADYFVKRHLEHLLSQDPAIDSVILGCTHYPLLLPKIVKYAPSSVRFLTQGDIVADSLSDYLRRHSELESKCSKGGTCRYYTTESVEKFHASARLFLQEDLDVHHIDLGVTF